jgi:hypothetical protein
MAIYLVNGDNCRLMPRGQFTCIFRLAREITTRPRQEHRAERILRLRLHKDSVTLEELIESLKVSSSQDPA